MDKLAAYKVLGLEEGASVEAIKEAYAALSKEYHPEENPEEFQLLHEAYVTLTRGNRRQRFVSEDTFSLAQITREEKTRNERVFAHTTQEELDDKDFDDSRENVLNFARSIKQVEKQVEEVPVFEDDATKAQALAYARSIREAQNHEIDKLDVAQQYDFDASVAQAEKEELEKIWRLGRQLADELDDKFSSSDYNNIKKMKAFFARKEFEKALYSEVFLESLARQLEETPVKPAIYSYIIQFYRLKGCKIEQLIPEAQRLYRAIDSRYSIMKDTYATQKSNTRIGIGAGIVGGLISAGRSLLKYGPKIFRNYLEELFEDISFLIPIIILIVVGLLVYKFFAKRTAEEKENSK